MLNATDLSAPLIVLAGTMGAFGGAREGDAGVVVTLLFVLGGFFVSLMLARVFNALACAIDRSERLHAGVALVLHLAVYGFSPFIAVLGMFWLSVLLARHVL